MTILRTLATLLLLLASHAFAAVDFGSHDFPVNEFDDLDEVRAACDEGSDSFWCDLEAETVTRVPTKGVDVFVDDAGHVLAAYGKHQKGQTLGTYQLDTRQNLIPPEASVPGAALQVGDTRLRPEGAPEASWERVDDVTVRGTFRFETEAWRVEKTVTVSNVRHTVDVEARVEPLEGTAVPEDAALRVVFPGISNVDDPVLKVGQGVGEEGTSSTDPLSQPVSDPSYASLQNNDRNTAFAIVLRPEGRYEGLTALPLPPDRMALQVPVAADGASLALDAYLGPNELVRYHQEGYLDLPGLFSPNILGRLSMGILWVLETIHDMVGSWGLAIIVLTLLFRIMIWPLIQTQTKSMFGMQKLQPKIQELQNKYKDDRQTLTQETMKLYKEYGVNPAGGCLPILAQMPLFIILWRVFVNFEFSEGFLWVPDLGQSDPYFILPILYVCVMFGMSYFSARGNPQSMRQQIIINLVFAFILFGFPAGVLLYFVVSMGVQVFQYWLIQRQSDGTLQPVGAAAGATAAPANAPAVPDAPEPPADAGGEDGSEAPEPEPAKPKGKGTSNRRGPAKKRRGTSGKARAKSKSGGA